MMPILQIYYPKDALSADRKAALAGQLTEVLLNMEGGASTQGGLAFATVFFTAISAGDWWVGGRTDAAYVNKPGKFLVRLSVPEGYMGQTHKSEVHAMVNAAFLRVLGEGEGEGDADDSRQGSSILVTIEEVTEGNWGCGGRTISLASIADAVGLSKSGARFRWVQAYFAAKARQFAATGYPADTGGLLPQHRDEARRPA
jgi:phenylpyruvate tautomerase PptA (4-oxalocrotonate tautomerase family)